MTSKIYLQSSLAGHRRGRLLTKLLKAEALKENPPESGTTLMMGQDFQALSEEDQNHWFDWCSKPGRTLLLIPPFKEGIIAEEIDWSVSFREPPVASTATSLAGLLADEVNQALDGSDGAFDRSQEHQWQDLTANSRFVKKHAGTGVFAATALPVWSITLLGKGEILLAWISSLHEHAGKPSNLVQENNDNDIELEAIDYTTMVCIYGWNNSDADRLFEKISGSGGVALFTIDRPSMNLSLQRLRQTGCVVENNNALSLSEKGASLLEASPYQAYAEYLRESS